MRPYAGEPADPMHAADGGCLFHGRSPADPRCPDRAILHVLFRDREYGMAAVAACAGHEHIARGLGPVLYEHKFGPDCGMPGAVWLAPPENRCVLDASGVRPAGVIARHRSGHGVQPTDFSREDR